MSALRRLFARLAATFDGHDRAGEDSRAEMAAHLEMEVEENIRRGMRPVEARRAALIAAGGIVQAGESVREQRGLPWIENLVADTRYAIRHFRRTPLTTATMVLVLSLGIGTAVVLFTLLNSFATMPAPGMTRAESLVRIRGTMQGYGSVQSRMLSWPEVQEYSGRTELFSSVAAYAEGTGALDAGDEVPATVNLIFTTPEYFGILGVGPLIGTEPVHDGSVGTTISPTALISYAMWQQRFGGSPDVIGSTLRINGVPVQVTGVAPPRFLGTDGGRGATLWLPLGAYPLLQKRSEAAFMSYDSLFLYAAARLNPGVTAAAATPAVAGIGARAFRPAPAGTPAQVGRRSFTTLRGGEVGGADVVTMLVSNSRVRMPSGLISATLAAGGFALLILLITSTNVSALLVGMASARRREIGVRLSLGAPRRRLVRQLLTESALLALIAAAVGLGVTALGIRFLGAALEEVQLVVDWRVTVATCTVALLTGILFGVSPALHATRVSVGTVLKNSATAVVASRSNLQRGLVVAQIALTQPLLVGLGVLVMTMTSDVRSHAVPGVPERIAEIEVDTWAGGLSDADRTSLIAALVERVSAVPGVTAAMPLQPGPITAPVSVHPDDRVPGVPADRSMDASMIAAPEHYFAAFEIPFVRGRDFDAAERTPSGDALRPLMFGAAVIGSDLARRLWGSADPIGRRLVINVGDRDPHPPLVVVGVVDEAAAGPAEVNGGIRLYIPFSPFTGGVIARTAGPALPLLDAVRQAVAAEAPGVPISRVQTAAQRVAEERRDLLRTSSAVAGGGLLALLLSAIGLYAVVSLGVSQRTREIGVRTALGAPGARIVRMFFGQGLLLSGIGLTLGLPLSIVVMRIFATTLNWPLTNPPLLGVAIGALVLAVASTAVWIPARRASAVDPLTALRLE
jgi:predicted permease